MQNGMICLRRQIQEIPAMLLGQDQRMTKMNWINIKERDDVVILKQDFSRYFSGYYFAENAIGHEIHLILAGNLSKYARKVKECTTTRRLQNDKMNLHLLSLTGVSGVASTPK